jgi:hypothetical protein
MFFIRQCSYLIQKERFQKHPVNWSTKVNYITVPIEPKNKDFVNMEEANYNFFFISTNIIQILV